jgi:hypothetical protein
VLILVISTFLAIYGMSIPSEWQRCVAALSKFLIKTHHCFLESLAEIINKLRISVFSTTPFIHRDGYAQDQSKPAYWCLVAVHLERRTVQIETQLKASALRHSPRVPLWLKYNLNIHR